MSTRITTPSFVASFPCLFEPSGFEGADKKYSVTMLWDKEEDLSALKAACEAAIVKKFGDKRPANIQMPMKDGNEKLDAEGNVRPEYKNKKYAIAKAKETDPPKVVDLELNPILDKSEIYGGCELRAAVSAYAWSFASKHGVSLYLGNVQKTGAGEAFGGGGNSVESDLGF